MVSVLASVKVYFLTRILWDGKRIRVLVQTLISCGNSEFTILGNYKKLTQKNGVKRCVTLLWIRNKMEESIMGRGLGRKGGIPVPKSCTT